jgi:small acid-soluble spore protein (thioredoxin-like protein)
MGNANLCTLLRKGGIVMSRITPQPNDSANNEERLENTIDNMEAAEEALNLADGKERELIKKANARRKESIEGMKNEIIEQDKSRINGYL